MRVEIIAVGTELLLGQIVNSNAAEIGSRLAGSPTGELAVLTRATELPALAREFAPEELGRINEGRDETLLLRLTPR